MEFEKDKPASAEEIALADAPHMSVNPAHSDIQPNAANVPSAARPDNRNFEFETESTAELAMSNAGGKRQSHHRNALVLALLTVVLFGVAIAVWYVYR